MNLGTGAAVVIEVVAIVLFVVTKYRKTAIALAIVGLAALVLTS